MKDDKPIPDGVFWMVWDDSGNYPERTLCPTKSWAKDSMYEFRSMLHEGKWRITKVKVTSE